MNMISKTRLVAKNMICARERTKGFTQKQISAYSLGVIILLIVLLPVLVIAQNNPPVANAGDDQSVLAGEPVYLHGSAIDSNNDPIVSWTWSIDSMPIGSTVLLSNPNAQSPTFTPYLVGKYCISLIVRDGMNDSLPDSVVIEVAANMVPVSITEGMVGKFP